jgi:hypothetical protein
VNNLCFKCGDKYTPTHTCPAPASTLNVLECLTFDGGGFLSDELLEALEAPQLNMLQDECFFVFACNVIQLRALVQNQALIILVDSSSSHTLLNSAIATKLQVTRTAIPTLFVRVANGASLPCTAEVKKFEWWIQGFTFTVDAKILEMGAYDLVLGMD